LLDTRNIVNRKLRIGLIVNPFSGIGGALALKGSDGADIRARALNAGARKNAIPRTITALEKICEYSDAFEILTVAGDMGESSCQQLGLACTIVYCANEAQTEAHDTIEATCELLKQKIDILVFAGGDGTARNIFTADLEQIPVLGIPTGCKIHSGVYAITPQAAGDLLVKILKGELVSLMSAEVRDIDEEKFRKGVVVAKYFGEMMVPADLAYIQAVKSGGKEQDELVLLDIADEVKTLMDDNADVYFVMGSGSTVDAVMGELQLNNTLLGIDIVFKGEVLANDVNSEQLKSFTKAKRCKLIITAIGGQGHIFGRGNQQLSPDFIKGLDRSDIIIVATKNKLKALANNGFIADTGDPELDASLAGPISVITGYNDKVLYFVRG